METLIPNQRQESDAKGKDFPPAPCEGQLEEPVWWGWSHPWEGENDRRVESEAAVWREGARKGWNWLVSTETSIVMFCVNPFCRSHTRFSCSSLFFFLANMRKVQAWNNFILKHRLINCHTHTTRWQRESYEFRFHPFCASICGLLNHLKLPSRSSRYFKI